MVAWAAGIEKGPSIDSGERTLTLPDRAGLEALQRERRRSFKPDLLPWKASALVKDVSRRRGPARWWGRWQLAREAAIYRRLEGVPGIPAWCRRIDADAIAIAWAGSHQLIEATDRFTRAERYHRELCETVAAIHARGVVHLDLRGRHNVVVDGEGRATIVDFAGGLCLRPGGLWMRIFASVDRAALLKWQQTLLIGPLDRDEARRARRQRRWRAWWRLNPKRRGHP